MSNTTEYAGLTTWDPYGADANVEGRAFVAGVAGEEATSNMQKIDTLLESKASFIVKTSTQWASDTTVLRANDFGVASDTGVIKRGNGIDTWASLSEFDPTYENFVEAGYTGSQSDFYTLLADTKAIISPEETALSGTALRADDVSPFEPNIIEWKQYGQCVQDGTPTPAAPVAISGKVAGAKVGSKNLLAPLGNPVWTLGNTSDWKCRTLQTLVSLPFTYAANQYNGVPVACFTVTPNTTYTIKSCPTKYIVGTEYVQESDITSVANAVSSFPASTVAPYTFTTSANTRCVMIGFSNYTNTESVVVDENTELQIELGTTATAYEPYKTVQTQTVTDSNGDAVTLYGIPVESGGNVTIDGQQYVADSIEGTTLTRRVGVTVFDGTEDWIQYSTSVPHLFKLNGFTPRGKSGSLNPSFNTHFPWDGGSLTAGRNEHRFASGADPLSVFYVSCADYTTLSDFKDFLVAQAANGNPMMLMYALSEPTTETVTITPATVAANSPTTTWLSDAHSEITYNKNVAASDLIKAVNKKAENIHDHGNITSDGRVGTDADKILVTGEGGAIVTKSGAEARTLLNIQDGIDGVGVQSVEQTVSSSEDNGTNVVTVTLTNGNISTFNVQNGSRGTNGLVGSDGTTFTPAVSAEGVISWTNDGDTENPESVNIKGPAGPNEISSATATAINGLIKGNGSNAAQAVAGTDYALPATDLTATLAVAGWSIQAPYTQTVNVADITAAMKPVVDIVLSDTQSTAETELIDWGKVSKIETGAGTITATCFTAVPTVALNLIMKVVG